MKTTILTFALALSTMPLTFAATQTPAPDTTGAAAARGLGGCPAGGSLDTAVCSPVGQRGLAGTRESVVEEG